MTADMHDLKNGIMAHAGHIALAHDADEVAIHMAALQSIADTLADEFGGERTDVRRLVRDGIGWASGPVRAVALKYGMV